MESGDVILYVPSPSSGMRAPFDRWIVAGSRTGRAADAAAGPSLAAAASGPAPRGAGPSQVPVPD
jgi:hypothetical protein